MSKVDFKVEPPIAYITFNSPDTLNAFNNHGAVAAVPYIVLPTHPIHSWYPDHDAFADALEEAEKRPDVYLTGMCCVATNSPTNSLVF